MIAAMDTAIISGRLVAAARKLQKESHSTIKVAKVISCSPCRSADVWPFCW